MEATLRAAILARRIGACLLVTIDSSLRLVLAADGAPTITSEGLPIRENVGDMFLSIVPDPEKEV